MNFNRFFSALALLCMMTKTYGMKSEEDRSILQENTDVILPLIVYFSRCSGGHAAPMITNVRQALLKHIVPAKIEKLCPDSNFEAFKRLNEDQRVAVMQRVNLKNLIGVDGETVLHSLLSSSMCMKDGVLSYAFHIVREIARENPTMLEVRRISDGFTPMHCIAANTSASIDSKYYLMSKFVAANSAVECIKNNDGHTPLDLLTDDLLLLAKSKCSDLVNRELRILIVAAYDNRQSSLAQTKNQDQKQQADSTATATRINDSSSGLNKGNGKQQVPGNNDHADKKQNGTPLLFQMSGKMQTPVVVAAAAFVVIGCCMAAYRYFNRKQHASNMHADV